jgi:hypothetical protein
MAAKGRVGGAAEAHTMCATKAKSHRRQKNRKLSGPGIEAVAPGPGTGTGLQAESPAGEA